MVTGFSMGSGCFHHFRHLNTGSFPLLTQCLFLELPLSLRACTQVEMFNRIVERKEGHPGDALCSDSPVLAPDAGRWLAAPPSPTLYCGQALPALSKAFLQAC